MLYSARGVTSMTSVDEYPDDLSPYGVRGMAGNVRVWCADRLGGDLTGDGKEELRCYRGGCWFATPDGCRTAGRHTVPAHARSAGVGIRLVRDIGPRRAD